GLAQRLGTDLDSVRPLADRAAVALGELARAAAVCLVGEQYAHRQPGALDVAVERLVEARRILHRHERVEEDDSTGCLVVDAADLLRPAVGPAVRGCPRRVATRPVPNPGRELLYTHRRPSWHATIPGVRRGRYLVVVVAAAIVAGGAYAAVSRSAARIPVTEKEWGVAPRPISAKAGSVTFVVTNIGH